MIKYPKEFTPQKGISPASLFIKGPDEWAVGLAKKLEAKYKRLTTIVGDSKYTGQYDIKHAQEAEVFVINFRDIDSANILLVPVARLSHFPPITYIYIDGRNKNKDLWMPVIELSGFKLYDSLDEIEENIDKDFAYLNELVVTAEDFFANHLTNGKRMVKSKRGRKPKLKKGE